MAFNGSATDPHQGQPVLTAGLPLEDAESAMIMLHGRGAGAANILSLAASLAIQGFAFFAPEARNSTWYPNSFLAPIDSNEPGISSGLTVIGDIITRINSAGIPTERIVLLGFSQGACLTSEFAARNATRYGGLAILSGGLIGPDNTPRDYAGSFDNTPVFMGCSDVDFHIPAVRVTESAVILKRMGANVNVQLYPGMGHTVSDEEIAQVRLVMEQAAGIAG